MGAQDGWMNEAVKTRLGRGDQLAGRPMDSRRPEWPKRPSDEQRVARPYRSGDQTAGQNSARRSRRDRPTLARNSGWEGGKPLLAPENLPSPIPFSRSAMEGLSACAVGLSKVAYRANRREGSFLEEVRSGYDGGMRIGLITTGSELLLAQRDKSEIERAETERARSEQTKRVNTEQDKHGESEKAIVETEDTEREIS